MKFKILLIPSCKKLPSFKVMACSVLKFSAIYWARSGKHPRVIVGLIKIKVTIWFLTLFSRLLINFKMLQMLCPSSPYVNMSQRECKFFKTIPCIDQFGDHQTMSIRCFAVDVETIVNVTMFQTSVLLEHLFICHSFTSGYTYTG